MSVRHLSDMDLFPPIELFLNSIDSYNALYIIQLGPILVFFNLLNKRKIRTKIHVKNWHCHLKIFRQLMTCQKSYEFVDVP